MKIYNLNMIGRVKKILGIDSLKLEIITKDRYDNRASCIEAELVVLGKCDGNIREIEVSVIEKYSRGRFGGKQTDQYVIGFMRTGQNLPFRNGKVLTIPVNIPVKYLQSPMDKFGQKNFIARGLSSGAKLLRGVRSDFRLEVNIKIDGSAVKVFKTAPLKIVE